jgi:hypothetical protein
MRKSNCGMGSAVRLRRSRAAYDRTKRRWLQAPVGQRWVKGANFVASQDYS